MIDYTFQTHLSFPCPRSAILGILDLSLPLLLASVSKLAQQRLCRGYKGSRTERGDEKKDRFVFHYQEKVTFSFVFNIQLINWVWKEHCYIYLCHPEYNHLHNSSYCIKWPLQPPETYFHNSSLYIETMPRANHQSLVSAGQTIIQTGQPNAPNSMQLDPRQQTIVSIAAKKT